VQVADLPEGERGVGAHLRIGIADQEDQLCHAHLPLAAVAHAVAVGVVEGVRPDAPEGQRHPRPVQRVAVVDPGVGECRVEFAAILHPQHADFFFEREAVRLGFHRCGHGDWRW
jgi:hypothetical protein